MTEPANSPATVGDRSMWPTFVAGPPALADRPVFAPPAPSTPPVASRPEHDAARPRRRRGVAIVAAALLAGTAGGYVAGSLASGDSTAAPPIAGQPVSLEPGAGALEVASVVAAVEPSVVSVETRIVERRGPFAAEGTGAGTGIVFDDAGHILTNAHVVEGANEVAVTVAGESVARSASVLAADASNDIAVLLVDDPTGLVPARLGSSADVGVGDDVVAIGNALALEGGLTVTRGIVSAIDRNIDTRRGTIDGLLQTDAAISSGNSGGPLANAAGEVIGINTAVATSGGGVSASNIGFAIPIDTAVRIAQGLI
jgi:putative serine protease PepD